MGTREFREVGQKRGRGEMDGRVSLITIVE